jgi:hypothetical protein
VFNPPYVPTCDVELDDAQRDANIAGSWAGGADGMQVTDAFLRQVDVRVPSASSVHPCHISVGPALAPGPILSGRCEAKWCPENSGIHVESRLTAE